MTAKLTCTLRPFVYGLAIGGKLGARDAVRGLLAVSIPDFPTYVRNIDLIRYTGP